METMVEVPVSVLLTAVSVLCVTIASMAGIIWKFVNHRLSQQDKIIEGQSHIIENLQADIERLSKGCGADNCTWRNR